MELAREVDTLKSESKIAEVINLNGQVSGCVAKIHVRMSRDVMQENLSKKN